MAKKCIICQKDVDERNAVRVKEDSVIRIIRKIKTTLGIAKGNELYVCNADIKVHEDKRKGYEKSVMVFAVIGAVVFLLLIVLPLLARRFDAGYFLASLFLSAMVVIVPIFFKYVPGVEEAGAKGNAGLKEPAKQANRKQAKIKQSAKKIKG